MRGKRKIKTGVVVSNRMTKTVVVEVERTFRHPFFEKVVRRSTRFQVHDEESTCQVGDFVQIMETRPISKHKCWRVVKVLGKAKIRIHDRPKALREAKDKEEVTSDTAAKPSSGS